MARSGERSGVANKGVAMILKGDTENKRWDFLMGCGFHLVSVLTRGR